MPIESRQLLFKGPEDRDELAPAHSPPPLRARPVVFCPKHVVDSEERNTMAVEGRAAALLGFVSIMDPLPPKWSLDPNAAKPKSRTTFKIVPSEFLHRARIMRPQRAQATVSAFSQWVYSLYSSAHGSDEDRERGKEVEPAILEWRRKSACCVDNDYLSRFQSNWSMIFNGLHLGDEYPKDYYKIEDLSVNGEPLRASPDLIYQNARSSEVIIVEIKHSRLMIPKNLWPNIWAQLWCYSQIKVAREALKLTVVGEVWGEDWTSELWEGRKFSKRTRSLFMRASVRRDPRAPAYDRFFRSLFDIYRGTY